MTLSELAPGLDPNTGDFAIVETFHRWGIDTYYGVGGGGIMNVAKYLEPLLDPAMHVDGTPRMLSIGEYVAGFAPLGSYLANRKIAVACAVTGAASKLISCGMSEAKLHNIPAIYLMGLNASNHLHRAPLQDVTPDGMNLVAQLKAELGEDCYVIAEPSQLEPALRQAQRSLLESRPIVMALSPDVTGQPAKTDVPNRVRERVLVEEDVEKFMRTFPATAKGRRVIIYVGEEAVFSPDIQRLTTRLSTVLKAPTVWSINGANAVAADNPYSYGYISYGGNDRALELWRKITPDDVVITLGFCAGEYSLALENIHAGDTWHIGTATRAYAQVDGCFRHRCSGNYHQVRGDIGLALEAILPRLERLGSDLERPDVDTLTSFNVRTIDRNVRRDCVDFMAFYEQLPKYWQPNSIGFDDVCLAYKDRQYVTQRPHPNIQFWSMHHGSAMGSGFALGVGAKLANPALHTFMFCGDGCWRLFAGCLADVSRLGLRMFLINNGSYGIVRQGLGDIISQVDPSRYHGAIPTLDFVGVAKANGWDGMHLKPDLSNLPEIMEACYSPSRRSLLVEVPMDVSQVIGPSRPLIWRKRPNHPTNW